MAIVSAIFSVMLVFLIIGTIIVIIFDSGDSATKIAYNHHFAYYRTPSVFYGWN